MCGGQQGIGQGRTVAAAPVKSDHEERLILTITKEDGAQDTFIVGRGNQQAYALVGTLKGGEKVRLSWVTEGTNPQKWIRNIRRLEEKKQGDGADTNGIR